MKKVSFLHANDVAGQGIPSENKQEQVAVNAQNPPPIHGGDLVSVSARFGIAIEDWIDLSTGVNPEPYPVPPVPTDAFEQLPYLKPEFEMAVAEYYGSPDGLAVCGTQAAIQRLPELLPSLPVLLPNVGYQEHHHAWFGRGSASAFNSNNACTFYNSLLPVEESMAEINQQLAQNPNRHLLVINPNNPSGLMIPPAQLADWAAHLGAGAALIVDEAFIDVTPEQSLLSFYNGQLPSNVIVLRSFGKFFGLAGIRLGFVFTAPKLRQALQACLGIWTINGPAQYIASQCLPDKAWQNAARQQIEQLKSDNIRRFAPLMQALNARPLPAQTLFQSYFMARAKALALQTFLAEQGVLVRVVDLPDNDDEALIRLGLPALGLSLPASDESNGSTAIINEKSQRLNDTLAAFLQQGLGE